MPESHLRPVAEPPGRRDEHERHHRDPERRPGGESVDRYHRAAPDEEGVGREGGYDEEVVQNGGEGREEEAPVGVQDAGRHGADAVEKDLQREHPEEQHRERGRLSCFLAGEALGRAPGGYQVDERAGEDAGDEDHDTEERQDRAEQRVGELAGVVLPVPREAFYEQGNEYGGEQPSHEELVELGREGVREGVGVRHGACAENGGLDHSPGVAGDARERGRYRHGERGSQDGGHTGKCYIPRSGGAAARKRCTNFYNNRSLQELERARAYQNKCSNADKPPTGGRPRAENHPPPRPPYPTSLPKG